MNLEIEPDMERWLCNSRAFDWIRHQSLSCKRAAAATSSVGGFAGMLQGPEDPNAPPLTQSDEVLLSRLRRGGIRPARCWMIDNDADVHSTGEYALFQTMEWSSPPATPGEGSDILPLGKGTVSIPVVIGNNCSDLVLENVYYAPGLPFSIISASRLGADGFSLRRDGEHKIEIIHVVDGEEQEVAAEGMNLVGFMASSPFLHIPSCECSVQEVNTSCAHYAR